MEIPVGESLSYNSNTSWFEINSSGYAVFTPNKSLASTNWSINISVNDSAGASTSRTAFIEIENNTLPYLNQTLNLTCSEDEECYLNISRYARDNTTGDYVVKFENVFANKSRSIQEFSMNTSTGVINFTPLQRSLGNYTLNVTLEDTKGGRSEENISIEVYNKNDLPLFKKYNFSNKTIVEDHLFNFEVEAEDQDLSLNGSENLTFSSNITFLNITSYSTQGNKTSALIESVPNSSQTGKHSINLSVEDASGERESKYFEFTVLNKTAQPNITKFTPFGNSSNSPVTSWNSTSNYSENIEPLNFSENRTLFFNITVEDDKTALENLTYNWSYDDSVISHNQSLNKTFGFFSSGTRLLRVEVNDHTLENNSWSWNLSITNNNRPPVIKNSLSTGMEVNSTVTYSSYFLFQNGKTRFFDPDDDVDGSGVIDGNETSNLTYTHSSCSYASLTVTDHNLKVSPESVGKCTVTFTAEDSGGLTKQSSQVTINITGVPDTTTSSSSSSSSSAGGGGGTTSYMPLTKEVEKTKPFRILATKVVANQQNKTISIPVKLKNQGEEDLQFVVLDASANITGVILEFEKRFFDNISLNSTAETLLEVSNYSEYKGFTINISANVTSPEYHDSSEIVINSLRTTEERRGLNNKVEFARDLVSQNKECQELKELLIDSEKKIEEEEYRRAKELLDVVINGCKYLMKEGGEGGEEEKPMLVGEDLVLDKKTVTYSLYTLAVLIVLTTIAFLIYYHYENKKENLNF